MTSWYCDIAVWSEKPSVVQVFSDDGQEQDYLPERTCRREPMEIKDGLTAYFCSVCDGLMYEDEPYCPNCGARVIE